MHNALDRATTKMFDNNGQIHGKDAYVLNDSHQPQNVSQLPVGVITLRPDQVEVTEKLREGYRNGVRRQLLAAATGFGKTIVFSEYAKSASRKGLRVLIGTHRAEILDQICATLDRCGVPRGTIRAGEPMFPRATVQVASIPTLVRRLDQIQKPDLAIWDECFPAGTMIGDVPIERVRVGDHVSGLRRERVLYTMRRRPTAMIRIGFVEGTSLACTPNHPILTNRGFVRAINLTASDVVVTISDASMHYLRSTGEEETLRIVGMSVQEIEAHDSGDIQEAWRGDHSLSSNEWNVETGGEGIGIHETSCDGLEASGSRRERTRTNGSGTSFGVGVGMADELCCAYGFSPFGIPDPLQIGCRKLRFEGRNRNRWNESQLVGKEGSGQTEGRIFEFDRVESITLQEPTSDGTFGGLCPDGFVYNLHVTGTETYSANGVIVHNCHHCCSNTWATVLAHLGNPFMLGVTATPERLDGRGLGEFFDGMVSGPPTQWLIDQGILARPRYFGAAPESTPDLKGIHQVAGDFNKSELSLAVDKPTITGDAVQHYLSIARDRTAIAFCINLKHAANVRDQFAAAGVPCEIIDGEMSREDRARVIGNLRSGQTKVLISVDLVSEGFDLPAVGAAILLRPTKSLALHRQQIGRALRMAPGKESALIIDHVGNTLRHGPVEEPIEWNLAGGAAKKRKETPIQTIQCAKCYAIFSGDQCPQCGVQREIKAREIVHRNGTLKELTPEELSARRARHMEEGRCESLGELMALAKSRGYARGWAWHRWQARQKRHTGPVDSSYPTLKQHELIPA